MNVATHLAAVVLGLVAGASLGWRSAIATRTYRDARATTRAARALWRQVPRDWARLGNWAGGVAIVVFVAVAYYLGSR